MLIFLVIHLAQFVHTDMALGSKRVTSIEKKSIPESDTNYDVRMKLYSKNPRVTSSEYIEISIYTKIFYFVSDAFTVSEVLDAAREAAQNTLGGLPNNLISGGSDSDQASTEEPIEPKTRLILSICWYGFFKAVFISLTFHGKTSSGKNHFLFFSSKN